ncbi:MAG: 3'(2'),5'-bisphosphate nucleotidase CysQ [Bosea sp. (in: a-proteobacteria)]
MEAGEMALADFRLGEATSARIWSKAGGSPVTAADVTVDTFLKIRLSELLPDAGWLSEETVDEPSRLTRRHVWVVDPIDGTRAFMSGDPDWAVCIALLDDGEPVLGLVHAPAHGKTYRATSQSLAEMNGAPIRASDIATLNGARVAGPKPMLDALARQKPILPQPKVPSLALRIARIAEGVLDVGLVSPDSRDWDIAAADLILRQAGGSLRGFGGQRDGEAPRYNRENPVHGVLYAAGNALIDPLGEAMLGWKEQMMAPFQRR